MKAFWIYTGARFGLFAVIYGVIVGAYLLVNGGGPFPVFWPLIVAALASTLVSAWVLRDLRDKVAMGIQARAERMTRKVEEMRAKEDADEDRGA